MSQTVVFRNAPWSPSHGFTLNDHTHRIVRLFLSNVYQGVRTNPAKSTFSTRSWPWLIRTSSTPCSTTLPGWRGTGCRALIASSATTSLWRYPYTRAVSACFAIGAVRRMRQPGCKLDTMPVAKGPQGFGKSTAVQALFSRPWFTDADMGGVKDKDAAMKLRGVWCVEFAEIDSLTKAATGDLKAFLVPRHGPPARSVWPDRGRPPQAVCVHRHGQRRRLPEDF